MERRRWKTLPTDVEEARAELELWRKKHRRGSRFPPELWEKAVCLARVHGVSPIARTLRLNYDRLKSEVDGTKKRRASRPRTSSQTPTFVEVGVATTPQSAQCVIELENSRGDRLRIRLARTSDLDLTGLAKALWPRRR